ncbi:hypothetical protein FOA52_005688 [Chlamydomonas sp. UWO 241]|nr:hypothetical protein FOA52_005688 [Chlamydomonas sp. UWO 241]
MAVVGGGELQRLAKVMAAAGVASRRACEDLIERGVVKVNSVVVNTQGALVNPEKDSIQVEGKKVSVLKPDLFYFMVNKPKGYICSNVDTRDRPEDAAGKRVVDILESWMTDFAKKKKPNELPPRFFTVGRLDVASHGLILVTNDGHWANKVIHPSSALTKEYVVLVDKSPKRSHLDTIMAGAEIDGVKVMPEEVSILEGSTKLRVVVGEGKKHEQPEWDGGEDGWSGGSSASSSKTDDFISTATTGAATGAATSQTTGSSSSASSGAITDDFVSTTTAGATAAYAPPSPAPVPRIPSSLFQVRDPASGRAMWIWSVAPWQRVCAEAQLAADDAATALPTYVDGRPKRRPKQGRIQDAGFATPDSFPNVYTPEEWEALGEGWMLGRAQQARGHRQAQQAQRQEQGQTQHGQQEQQQRQQEQGAGGVAAGAGQSSSSGSSSSSAAEAGPPGAGSRQRELRSRGSDTADRAGSSDPGIGLLDPSLFDRNGRLLTGPALHAAMGALDEKERLEEEEGQRQGQGQAGGAGEERDEAGLIDDDFLCRDDWDWKVRILVAAAGLEVLSLKRVRIGGLRVPPSLGLGGYKQMGARDVAAVTNLTTQKKLRENAWSSAAMLLMRDDASEQEGATKRVV